MNKSDIFGFLNSNPAFHLATVEGNKPHVRGMLLYRADENGILFHTGKTKDIHRQLTENSNVEMCFSNGNFELIEDLELKKEIVEKHEFLKPWIEQMGYEPLAVYRMKNGITTIWTMKTNFAPKEFVEL